MRTNELVDRDRLGELLPLSRAELQLDRLLLSPGEEARAEALRRSGMSEEWIEGEILQTRWRAFSSRSNEASISDAPIEGAPLRTVFTCHSCKAPMEKIEFAHGGIKISPAEQLNNVGPAEECRECGISWCEDCYNSKVPGCPCGKAQDEIREHQGVLFRGSVHLTKMRYLARNESACFFRHPRIHYSLELPPSWATVDLAPPFGAVFESRHGHIRLGVGEVEDRLVDQMDRSRFLLQDLWKSGFKEVRLDEESGTPGGCTNVFAFRYRRPDNMKGYGLSCVRDHVLYNFQADGLNEAERATAFGYIERSLLFPPKWWIDQLKREANMLFLKKDNTGPSPGVLNHPSASSHRLVDAVLNRIADDPRCLGQCLTALKKQAVGQQKLYSDPVAAQKDLLRAHAIFEEIEPAKSLLGLAKADVAAAYSNSGEYKNAILYARDAISILGEVEATRYTEAMSRMTLGACLDRIGHHEAAAAELERARSVIDLIPNNRPLREALEKNIISLRTAGRPPRKPEAFAGLFYLLLLVVLVFAIRSCT